MNQRQRSSERDDWREANDNLPQKETTEMVWPHVKGGRGGYHQEDVEYAGVRKYRGDAQEKMDR